jgi:glutamate carboxypeptidase
MLSPLRFSCALIGLAVIATTMAHPQATPATASLTPIEQRMAGNVDANGAADLALLEQLVDTNSGTMHLAGVVAVKDILVPRFQKLGFRVKWVPMDTVTHRAGDLVAEHPCPAGEGHCGQRLLLVGHMDTVFEPSSPFQRYTIVPGSSGKIATGPGVADMKGGLVVMLAALRAMEFAEVLGNTEIRIVLSGDEERVGDPVDLARRDLVEAAKQSDVALEFEPSVRIDGQDSVSISRRSATTWQIEATGISGHSSQIFGDRLGYGAIYELNRILDTFRRDLPEDGLTYSVGLMLGGGTAQLNPDQTGGTATGKDNVVAATALAVGDLRTESNEQTQRVETKMRSIVEQHLPKTGATITFGDSYPAMATTPASEQLFRAWNEASESLALGPVQLGGPMSRGAGDIAFAAPYVPGLVGVGILGEGYHAVGETAFLDSLSKQAKRNAVLMERLVRQPAKH